jgi:hypothetical protein
VGQPRSPLPFILSTEPALLRLNLRDTGGHGLYTPLATSLPQPLAIRVYSGRDAGSRDRKNREVDMQNLSKRIAAVAVITLAMLSHAAALSSDSDREIAYPAGYRQWVHVKSSLVGPASPIFKRYGGLHHIYANEKALRGYQNGQFEDGSVIVFDLLETEESGGNTVESKRRFIDVMVKDSRRFADTGGWGFEEFNGDSQSERVLSPEAKVACYDCHAKRKEQGFVFSSFRK